MNTQSKRDLKELKMNETQTPGNRALSHKIAGGTVFLNVVVLLLGSLNERFIFFALTAVGIITFFGVLISINTASGDPDFSQGEIRKSLASSIIIFYLASTSLFISSKGEVPETVISNIITPFSWVVGAVIAFYFGNNAVNKFVKKNNKN